MRQPVSHCRRRTPSGLRRGEKRLVFKLSCLWRAFIKDADLAALMLAFLAAFQLLAGTRRPGCGRWRCGPAPLGKNEGAAEDASASDRYPHHHERMCNCQRADLPRVA